jgi:putative heme-binding domain-containing protein
MSGEEIAFAMRKDNRPSVHVRNQYHHLCQILRTHPDGRMTKICNIKTLLHQQQKSSRRLMPPTIMRIHQKLKKSTKLVLLFASCFLLFPACEKPADDESRFNGDVFSENIRSTEPRTPEEELAGFKVPPGFEIQLFASEPDIDKPINMTFDAKGRMWVTQSFEYPFPSAPGSKSTDKLTILEDTDGDGRADKFTVVSDTLNIPVGVLPLTDGVMAFSVPNVYHFTDSNGDDKPEGKQFVIGPFGYQDTHGMVSNFVRGYDGWIHACHGFTNLSVVAGSDGDSIKMISGNTFRFKPDGSRVEQMTFGQVNPFGLVYDELGYIYSTDSHSSPLYQLTRGADYPHFAKPEIMAFGPDMKSLEDEATALCGITYYADTKFPPEFQQNFFIGDAFRSRVHRYSWSFDGSSPKGKSEEDMIKSEDPWFRPVNVKVGPDGALYVADFYNAIIGHYEVPLGHPKRDKQRGRIWRITYKGEQNAKNDLTKANLEELVTTLNADNMVLRMNAADQIADRIGTSAAPSLVALVTDNNTPTRQHVLALWLLYRLNALPEDLLAQAIASNDPVIRLHTLRILAEGAGDWATFQGPILKSLSDTDPHVRRAATELMIHYKDLTSVEAVLALLRDTPAADRHLIYTGRLVLRNLLRDETLMKAVGTKTWDDADADFIAGTLVDVHSPEAALFLSSYLENHTMPADKTRLAYQQIARYTPAARLNTAIQSARNKKDIDVEMQASLFRGIQDGLAQRGVKEQATMIKDWGTSIAQALLQKYPDPTTDDKIIRQQRFAVQLAEDYKVSGVAGQLEDLVSPPEGASMPPTNLRSSALHALLAIAPAQYIGLAGSIVNDSTVDMGLRKNAAAALGEIPGPEVNKMLGSIANVPADLETAVVTSLAGSPEGKNLVLEKVRSGQFHTRTLIDPRVEERLMLNITPQQEEALRLLTANVEPISEEREKLIEERVSSYKLAETTSLEATAGQEVFSRNCGVCHKSMTESGIGPQLHGIGKRGPEAIAEKILDPNRNISEAFRNYTIKLKDGKVLTGLYRREQGEVIVFGDLTGKEFMVPKKDIVSQLASRYTIMPDYFGTTLSQKEFNNLLTYLLNY